MSLGIVLLPLSLLGVAGSVIVIFIPDPPNPYLNLVAGTVLTALSLWITLHIARMAFNITRGRAGLFGPRTLRVIGVCMMLLPVVAIFFGTFQDQPVAHSVMAVAYLTVSAGLWILADARRGPPR